jgi:hypothetical protein
VVKVASIVFQRRGPGSPASSPCGRSGRCSFQAQLIGNRLLDNRTFEEARIVARVQHGGIGERELAKILCGDETLLDHLERFGDDIRKVGASKCVKSELNTRKLGVASWILDSAAIGAPDNVFSPNEFSERDNGRGLDGHVAD